MKGSSYWSQFVSSIKYKPVVDADVAVVAVVDAVVVAGGSEACSGS